MNLQAYYLTFDGPLHLGDHKPDNYESSAVYLRSDTLHAAIIAAWAKMGEEQWIDESKTPFTLSSAFPFYIKDKNITRFLPRVKLPFSISDRESGDAKKLKKIAWVDQDYFEKTIQNSPFDNNYRDHIQGEFITSTVLPDNGFIHKQLSERVTVPRNFKEKDSEPFHMERIYFDNGGLYFFAEGNELEKLDKALDLLRYEGFGTDRSIGNGFFTWCKSMVELSVPKDCNYATNIGLYCPISKDHIAAQLDEKSAFETVKRGGWITTEGHQSIEKNSIYMFAEGSIFNTQNLIDGLPYIDLTPYLLQQPMRPHHKIYRNGSSLFIPIKIN
jgi:CRISPR-associated protein Csm4